MAEQNIIHSVVISPTLVQNNWEKKKNEILAWHFLPLALNNFFFCGDSDFLWENIVQVVKNFVRHISRV